MCKHQGQGGVLQAGQTGAAGAQPSGARRPEEEEEEEKEEEEEEEEEGGGGGEGTGRQSPSEKPSAPGWADRSQAFGNAMADARKNSLWRHSWGQGHGNQNRSASRVPSPSGGPGA
ncbi:unnamed protein product [Prorocentrum cordatum]|uniref:Uncharacterized protein n=1 Tax=Prorocentrum cordatum TaxID=2364126 RepID=A0ABN9QP09_9DINO|nr:unnamed protein product [Polarella glacialis]